MTIKTKFVLWSLLLITMVIALGSVSVWNLTEFWRATRATSAEYQAMDRADAVSVQVAWLRDTLRTTDASNYTDPKFYASIQKDVTEVVQSLRLAAGVDHGDAAAQTELARSIEDHLSAAIGHATGADPQHPASKIASAANELEGVRKSLQAVSKLMPTSARHHVAVAMDQLQSRLAWTCALLLVVLLVSAAIHIKQFRMLVRPLLWLREEMRRSAARDFKDEIAPRGDREFRDLAGYFNGLARELAELYKNLEAKVIARSRELVRSERLASVGFLAAGVAHEINNPLSVMSGYAELAAKSLRQVMLGEGGTSGSDAEAEAEALASAFEAQNIIRDEAFRCKEITNRLLSLARGSNSENRQAMRLDEVAQQVSILTRGLKNYSDRRVVLDFKQADPLNVVANLTEMKQVLLNLTVNALEAVPPNQGEVRIGGRRTGDWVELSVEDNGKGMSAETLEHVFEPFFTAKRGAGEPGTGLGLSITHAIVESHGGRLQAESGGPGRGSRFTLRLPASGTATAAAAQRAATAGAA